MPGCFVTRPSEYSSGEPVGSLVVGEVLQVSDKSELVAARLGREAVEQRAPTRNDDSAVRPSATQARAFGTALPLCRFADRRRVANVLVAPGETRRFTSGRAEFSTGKSHELFDHAAVSQKASHRTLSHPRQAD